MATTLHMHENITKSLVHKVVEEKRPDRGPAASHSSPAGTGDLGNRQCRSFSRNHIYALVRRTTYTPGHLTNST